MIQNAIIDIANRFDDSIGKTDDKIDDEYSNNGLKKRLHDRIVANHADLWLPSTNKRYTNLLTNSCFDVKTLVNTSKTHSLLEMNDLDSKFKNTLIKCERVFLLPSDRQKSILNLWLNACTDMYNLTLKEIKSVLPFKQIIDLPFYYKLINDSGFRKGSLVKKIEGLDKKIKAIKSKMKNLLRYIQVTDRKRTAATKRTFHSKMDQYIILKEELGKKNIALNELKNDCAKYTKYFNLIENKVKSILDYKFIRSHVLKNKRNTIMENYPYMNTVKPKKDKKGKIIKICQKESKKLFFHIY